MAVGWSCGSVRPDPFDVVVACATALAPAALAVVRWTGPGAWWLADQLLQPMGPGPWRAGRTRRVRVMHEGRVLDDGVVVLGRAPATYTGEATAELTVHGNPFVVRQVLGAAVSLGAQIAGPGDFTRRALLHGKLDAVRAEAVLQVATAQTEAGLAVAHAGLHGQVSARWQGWRDTLLDAVAELEARLDHPEDVPTSVQDEVLQAEFLRIAAEAESWAGTAAMGARMVGGARVVLLGAVNAGKSSLFNALLGEDRAIVHDQAGTTRDRIEAVAEIGGVPVTLVDTAGARDTEDVVEAVGQAQAAHAARTADAVMVVLRATEAGLTPADRALLERTAHRPRVVLWHGIDRTPGGAAPDVAGLICTSLRPAQNLEAVRAAIGRVLVGELHAGGREVLASARQAGEALALAEALRDAVSGWAVAGEAVAADAVLRGLAAVDAALGLDVREAALDRLFARFCIGK